MSEAAGVLRILQGDCREQLRTLADCSVDSCVTDPPYELGFMGKEWDKRGVAYDVKVWAEVLRVLKPGAHMLAFGGTRTAHRMAVAIEDAGFEIRDSIHWMYGSGFPKSLDISKAIDRAAGVEREIVGRKWETRNGGGLQRSIINDDNWQPPQITDAVTTPATNLARLWDGWGTALKPAHEIIYLCRKPISESSITANVLRWGTGALNIDASRVGANYWTKKDGANSGSNGGHLQQIKNREAGVTRESSQGRWPANVVLSHSPLCEAGACHESCPLRELNRQSGECKTGGPGVTKINSNSPVYSGPASSQDRETIGYADSGGASRFYFNAEWSDDDFWPLFYYMAKASRGERDAGLDGLTDATMNRVNPGGLENDPRWQPIQVKNAHPTVKPVTLISYLLKLITPPGGVALDCFAGSGTMGRAAMEGGFRAILIEQDQTWLEVINRRCATQLGLPLA